VRCGQWRGRLEQPGYFWGHQQHGVLHRGGQRLRKFGDGSAECEPLGAASNYRTTREPNRIAGSNRHAQRHGIWLPPVPACQWWVNGVKVNGATNTSLVITNFQAAQQGDYQLVVANSIGSVWTTPASVFVNSPMRLDSFAYNMNGHSCQMRLIGVANSNYVIQASSDLQHWYPISTNAPSTGIWMTGDSYATNTMRFYRAVPGH
jgi:hypothetical protein